MRPLLLPLLFLPLMPAKAKQPDIKCPGNTTVEMRWWLQKALRRHLRQNLTRDAAKWAAATQEVCSAYAPYRQGTIYPNGRWLR